MKTRLFGFFIFSLVLLAWVIAANAQPIPGTIMAAAATTGDFANDFPIAFTFEIQGTDKQVPDIATRNLISAARRTEGMTCYVTGETNVYRLVGGTNNANWILWDSVTNVINVFNSINVTNITVQAPGGFTNLNLTPLTVMQTDANDAEASITPNALGMLTNSGAGVFGWTLDGGLLVNINNLSTSLSNFIAGQAAATNVVWPIAGTNVILTTNLLTVRIDVPGQTNGLVFDVFTTNSATSVSNIIQSIASNSVPMPVVTPGTDITITTNATGTQTNYTVGLTANSVTVNGTANHVTTTSASIALGGSATLDVGSSVVLRDANNVWVNTSSNFNNNAVWADATNANNTTPDFAIRTSTLSTNASFTWLLPTHLDGSGKVEQWIKTSVTNSSGSLITMSAPAGCHVCGAGANNVTNWTEVLWQYYPPSGPTNYWPVPGY